MPFSENFPVIWARTGLICIVLERAYPILIKRVSLRLQNKYIWFIFHSKWCLEEYPLSRTFYVSSSMHVFITLLLSIIEVVRTFERKTLDKFGIFLKCSKMQIESTLSFSWVGKRWDFFCSLVPTTVDELYLEKFHGSF